MANTKESLGFLHSLRRVGQGLQIHKHRMFEGAERTLGPGAGEVVGRFCDLSLAAIDRTKGRITAAENRVQAELADNAMYLDVRAERIIDGRAAFMDLRSALTLSWDEKTAERLGCGRVTPSRAEDLILALLNAAERWEAQRETLPEPRIKVDIDAAVRRASTSAEDLTKAVEDVAREVGEDRESRTDRRAALAEGVHVFEVVADTASAFLRLAGQHKLADQLKPSGRRRGQTTAVADGQDPVLEDPDAPLPVPPLEDAPAAGDEDAA